MSSETITLKLTSQQENQLYDAFKDTESKAPAYARYQLRPENCVITCYTSHKTVFQGKDAAVYASPFMEDKDSSSVLKDSPVLPQAGSDEVGTGDYFGPVCVCATIVTETNYPLVVKLGVRDSKKLSDEDIRKIAPVLMQSLKYSLLIVDNEKYNEIHSRYNMNAVKALLHNQAYVNLAQRQALPYLKVIDQFTPEPIYYHYLKGVPKIIYGIHFETKAEDKYPAVGCASVIARYAFLKKMDEMEEKYGMHFGKGAGKDADASARLYVKKYGKERLKEVAKLHFKNTEKL